MSRDDQLLLDDARAAAERAYAPYSRFRVGAIVVSEAGLAYSGVNMENAAFGSTICAEASAMAAAIAAGERRLTTIAVACLDAGECYPCGNCRQLMREFGVERVIVQAPDGAARVHTLDDLLPHSFGPESLGERG
jgi:cytidine deaminase